MPEKKFLDRTNCHKTFLEKSEKAQNMINDTMNILEEFGISITDKSPRLKEKIALGFLSLGGMDENTGWKGLKDITQVQRTTREIISHQNETYGEKRSSGSYDDVRREDLKELVLANIVLNTKPNAAKNDPTRKYGISQEYADVVRAYGTKGWDEKLKKILKEKGKFSEGTSAKREFEKIPVKISEEVQHYLSTGKHNELQKAVIEKFLPRFCPNGEVLYFGDTEKKQLINNREKLTSLNFFELEHGMLPDIVVYREDKNWIYLIEAVHTANPIKKTRKFELEKLTKNCKPAIIFVSTFLDRYTFRKYLADIAWETEVWLADEPDHMIHFNGEKFLGPYLK